MAVKLENDFLDGLPVGYELHGYVLRGVLGHGGFGVTYLAEHEIFHTSHAIKEFYPQDCIRSGTTVMAKSTQGQGDFQKWLNRFCDEARLLRSFHHPNIVQVTDVFKANGTAYFIMPYLEGTTLNKWLEEHSVLNKDKLLNIFIPLLEGVKYCHANNVLHRDIKLENIFMVAGAQPILIDFGSAKQTIGKESNSVVISHHFAPIEQYSTETTKTTSLDIYSIGACMYVAVSGKLPEQAPSRVEEDNQPRLAAIPYYAQRYGENFLAAIDKALEFRARDRFQNVGDFQKALLGTTIDGPTPQPTPPPPHPTPTPTPTPEPAHTPPKSANKTSPLLIVAILALIIGVAGYFLYSSSTTTTSGTQLNEQLPKSPVDPPIATLPTFTNSIGMEFVLIPSGSFMMGSDKAKDSDAQNYETPNHLVNISKPFYMGKYEVTQKQWLSVMGNNPSAFKGDNNPVEKVSWDDVQVFISKLNQKENISRYRLPTEAEWEYAARAGSETRYSFGDDKGQLGRYAWYADNEGKATHPVGQRQQNAWGLYDVYGNVWEWVNDWYAGNYYRESPSTDPRGPSTGSDRVNRGGSWSSFASRCRSPYRSVNSPGSQYSSLGFRLALTPEQQ